MISNIFTIALSFLIFTNSISTDVKTLAIGSPAPDFKLKSVNGKRYSLKSFKKAEILAIVFTCNHCPTAQAYEERLIKMAKEYKSRGVQIVAISPNDPSAVRLDELGYSDLNDSYADMIIRDEDKKFPFPYLYDGDNQLTAKAYGPVATPHIFIFDKMRKLRYQGRIDDVENPSKTPNINDARNAIEALLNKRSIENPTTRVFGCSIKWAEKSSWKEEYKVKWAQEKVELLPLKLSDVQQITNNKSGKLRLVNIWATWCGPCVREFPDLMEINHMYRYRDFEMITISMDDPGIKTKVKHFLDKNYASTINYIYTDEDKYKLMEAIDPSWQGAIPYTLLIDDHGKIVYRRQGSIDPRELKRVIVDNPLIGRFFKR